MSRTESKSAITCRVYDEIRLEYLERRLDRGVVQQALDEFAAEVMPGGLVLDVGCGPGFDTTELRRRGLRGVGVDLSLPMLRLGRQRYPGPYCHADMRGLPFLRRVAGIWACASMLHLQRQEFGGVLQGFSRVLRPEGVVSLSVKEGDGAGWDDHLGAQRLRWFTYWSDAALDTELECADFEIVRSSATTTPNTSWLRRLVRAKSRGSES